MSCLHSTLFVFILCLVRELHSQTTVATTQDVTQSSSITTVSGSSITTVVPTTITTCSPNSTFCGNATQKSNISTTTVQPENSTTNAPSSTTISSTVPAPTTAVPNIVKQIHKHTDKDVCTCDLQRQLCDINCCCDKDCTFDNKLIFEHCQRETDLYYDTKFCKYLDYMYVNHTPYEWEVNQNGLFCIVKSNLPPQYTLQKKQSIVTVDEAVLQKNDKYYWPYLDQQELIKKFNGTEAFSFGNPVWIIKNNRSVEQLYVPDSLISNVCTMKKYSTILDNTKIRCSQVQIEESNIHLNAETFYKNLTVIASPGKFRNWTLTGLKKCPSNICLPLETRICEENFENCYSLSKNISRSLVCHLSIFTKENSCRNVVHKVMYNLYHNSTKGFTRAEVLIALKNITYSLDEENFEFMQEYEVNYLWYNYTKNVSAVLSGNPGYIIGKPILIGNIKNITVVSNTSEGNTTTTYTPIIRRNSQIFAENFLVFPTNEKGFCIFNNHTYMPVLFGYNMILKCKFRYVVSIKNNNISGDNLCRYFQELIFKLWSIEIVANVSDINKAFGYFGNANENVFSDWAKILSNKNLSEILNSTKGSFSNSKDVLTCKNIVSYLRVDLFHSRIDLKSVSNQEKLIAVMYDFRKPNDFDFMIIKREQIIFEVDVHIEIMFFDVTVRKVKKFIDPPSFEIKLPYDFFYPFIKVGSFATKAVINSTMLWLTLFCILSHFV